MLSFTVASKFLLSEKKQAAYPLSFPTWALQGKETGIQGKSKYVLLFGPTDDDALFEK